MERVNSFTARQRVEHAEIDFSSLVEMDANGLHLGRFSLTSKWNQEFPRKKSEEMVHHDRQSGHRLDGIKFSKISFYSVS